MVAVLLYVAVVPLAPRERVHFALCRFHWACGGPQLKGQSRTAATALRIALFSKFSSLRRLDI